MIFLVLSLAAGIAAALTFANRAEWETKRSRAVLVAAFVMFVIGALTLPGGYIIQKIIGRLAMPIGMLWALSALLGIVGVAFKNRGMAASCFALFLGLTLAGSSLVGGWMAYWLEEDFATVRPFDEGKFDAVLVLGGGTSSRRGYSQVAESGDRVVLGARLYHSGQTPLLLTSGSSIPGLGAIHDSSKTTMRIWSDLGVPETAVLRIPDPKNTSEEFAALAELQKEKGWKRVGVVTSAWHMRRAMKLAEANGLEVVALPGDFRGDTDYEGILSFIPDPQGFSLTYRVCWELLGAAVGR